MKSSQASTPRQLQPYSDPSLPSQCPSSNSQDESLSHANCSECLNVAQQSKFMLNLESILFQEVKICQLVDELKKGELQVASLQNLCEDWWEISRDSSTLFDLHRIYKEDRTKQSIQQSLIFECITVLLVAHFTKIAGFNQPIKQQLQQLMECSHSNFLHVVMYVLNKMGVDQSSENVWASALLRII